MMDPHTKAFEPVPDRMADADPRQQWPRFRVGEEVEINGVTFRVRKITRKDLVLRPK